MSSDSNDSDFDEDDFDEDDFYLLDEYFEFPEDSSDVTYYYIDGPEDEDEYPTERNNELSDSYLQEWYNDENDDDDSDSEENVALNEKKDENKMVRTLPSQATNMLMFLHDCYKKQLHCDIAVTIGDKVFKSHRFVLGTNSEYFRELFQEQDKNSFTLQEESISVKKDGRRAVESFECILDFMYTGTVDFSRRDIEAVLNLVTACDHLGVTVLKGFCEDHLSTVTVKSKCI